MARPSVLNEELINNFCEEIEEGTPIKYICDMFYINPRSYNNWMKLGEEDVDNENYETIHAQFFLAIKKSQALYVKKIGIEIRKGERNWTSLAWWLERTNKEFRITSDDSNVTEPVIVNPSLPRNK